MSRAQVRSAAVTIALAIGSIVVGVYAKSVLWILVGLFVASLIVFLATFPWFPLEWRGFQGRATSTVNALLEHQIRVLESERQRLHNMFVNVRDSNDNMAASAGRDLLEHTVGPIVRHEIGHEGRLLAHFNDETGFNQPQHRNPQITETANLIERRYIRLGEILDALRARR
jgi:hypothetical protein